MGFIHHDFHQHLVDNTVDGSEIPNNQFIYLYGKYLIIHRVSYMLGGWEWDFCQGSRPC